MLRIFNHYQIDKRADGSPCVTVDDAAGTGLVKLTFDINVQTAIDHLNNTVDQLTKCRLGVARAKKRGGGLTMF